MAARFAAGGRLFTFGNGGSATDAESAADLFARPPSGRALPAASLVDDRAVLTALANDVGFDLVFSRQLIALRAAPATSRSASRRAATRANVLQAFAEGHAARAADRRACAGTTAARWRRATTSTTASSCRSDSVHRIQEAQDGLVSDLWSAVQARLGGRPGDRGDGMT